MPEQHVPSSNRAGSGEKIKISFRGRTQNSFGKRRKIVRFCPLWDGCDKNLSAILGNLNQRSDSVADIGDFNDPAPITSPLVLQASSRAQSSPEEAARWAAALPPGKEQDRAALVVIDRWTGTDPAAAAAWTTQFAEGPLREQAMSVVARQWGLRDWNAAAGWL